MQQASVRFSMLLVIALVVFVLILAIAGGLRTDVLQGSITYPSSAGSSFAMPSASFTYVSSAFSSEMSSSEDMVFSSDGLNAAKKPAGADCVHGFTCASGKCVDSKCT